MKKYRSACILLVAVAIVVLGALLPVLVGKIQDHTTMGDIDYGDVNELHFQLRDLTMAEKMGLLYNANTVEIDEAAESNSAEIDEEAESNSNNGRDDIVPNSSSSEDITAIFFNAIQPYIQNGLITDDNYMDKYETQHFLAYDVDDPNISNVFWLVNTSTDISNSELNVVIDEQTGAAMSIEYWASEPVYDGFAIEDLMWLCYQTFFDTMGVNNDNEVYVELIDVDVDTGAQIIYITWYDTDGGSISMELSFAENGFGIYVTDAINAEAAYDS